jgi:hypothetical protein
MCPTRAVFILCLTILYSAMCWFDEGEGGEDGLPDAVCASECAQERDGRDRFGRVIKSKMEVVG